MTPEEFVNKKQPTWSELESLLARARGAGRSRLSPSQLDRLGYLYRRVTSDLAVARRDFPRTPCVIYLNQLASRAHSGIYQTSPFKRGSLGQFLRTEFPVLCRANLIFIAAACLLFLLGFASAYWLAVTNPGFAEDIVPAHLLDHLHKTDKTTWNNTSAEARNLLSSFVITNNIRVAFLAFAAGIAFMLGSVYVLAFNGVFIGAIAGLSHVHGLSLALWSFVSPHGYIELTAIFIAGGAGLKMGYALIAPGLFTRKRALTEAAKTAVRLLGGCIALFLIAGIIEGFISPSGLPPSVKIGFGALTGVVLFSYLFKARTTEVNKRKL